MGGRAPVSRAELVRRRVATWAVASAVGAGVFRLPDVGPPVFRFSETHGPDARDLLGVALVVGGWLPVASLLWQRRGSIRGRSAKIFLGLNAVAIPALVATIRRDMGISWLGAVVALVAAQGVALHAIAVDERAMPSAADTPGRAPG